VKYLGLVLLTMTLAASAASAKTVSADASYTLTGECSQGRPFTSFVVLSGDAAPIKGSIYALGMGEVFCGAFVALSNCESKFGHFIINDGHSKIFNGVPWVVSFECR
jgi:hypothetical protein